MLRTAACVIVKDEERDIAEWLVYHSLLGFDCFIIFDNNSSDQTREIIKTASSSMYIKLITWDRNDARTQVEAYEEACKRFKSEFDWIGFFDADEFLVLHEHDHVSVYLSNFESYSGNAINWAVFGSNGFVDYHSKLLIESFTRRSTEKLFENRHVKSFIRPSALIRCENPHFFEISGSYCGPSGEKIQWLHDIYPESPLGLTNTVPDYSVSQINHFFTRSRMHWSKKVERGYPDGIEPRRIEDFEHYDRNDIQDFSATRFASLTRRTLNEWFKAGPVGDDGRRMTDAAPLFDVAFYSASRPDLVGSATDLLRHYVTHGWREGSCPHPLFDPKYAVWKAGAGWPEGIEPFGYWQQVGWQLGHAPHPLFDVSCIRAVVPNGDPLAGYARANVSSHALFDRAHYRAQALDLPAGMDPYAHYVLHGLRAGLTPHRLFDPAYYLLHRPDVAEAGLEPLAHYVQFGYAADSHPHPLIAPAHYRAQAGDVEPVTHYLAEGEMFSPHPLFDVAHYLAATGPIEGPPLLHYLNHPAPPATHPLFDEDSYRAQTGIVGPGLLHYLRHGAAAGHKLQPLFDSAGYAKVSWHEPPLLHSS